MSTFPSHFAISWRYVCRGIPRRYSLHNSKSQRVLIDVLQRPSARELLKHKFVRMAKKTNYLTELIERHERWRAEGGARQEEEGLECNEDL